VEVMSIKEHIRLR